MGTSTAFEAHDHGRCAASAIRRAEALAAERGLKLTPVRRRTLEILLEDHRALGAYDVLDRLAESGFSRQPPVAYRALEFLVDHGLAHRIARLNAFAACAHPGETHQPVFFICEACRTIAEAQSDRVRAAVADTARDLGFTVSRMGVEVVGRCPACEAGP